MMSVPKGGFERTNMQDSVIRKQLQGDRRLAALRDEYELGEEMEHGSLGTVLKAKKRSNGKTVVVRLFSVGSTGESQDIETAQIIKRRHVPIPGDEEEAEEGEEGEAPADGGAEGTPEDSGPTGNTSPGLGDRRSDRSEQAGEQGQEKPVDAFSFLSHPRIVDVHEVHRGDELFAIVTDEEEGTPLSRMLGDESWREEPDRAAEVAVEVAQGLHYLHDSGLLHLDLNPDTVVRDDEGEIRIRSLGVTQLCQSELGSGDIWATPAYVAPERLKSADETEIGPWSDLYSLGVFLYHATTGTLPAASPSVGETLEQQLEVQPEDPRARNPKISPFLGRVILRLLAKHPRHRYQAAQELQWDLERYLDLEGSERIEVGWKPRVWDPAPSAETGAFFLQRPETEEVTEQLTDVEDGKATRAALIRGGRGVGKTALLEHQAARLVYHGFTPVFAQASRHPASVAVIENLARGAVISILQSGPSSVEAWRRHFQEASPAVVALTDRIAELEQLTPVESDLEETSPDSRTSVMREVVAWRDLFEMFLSGPKKFVWAVDDAHELDELSREILSEFICRRTVLGSRWMLTQTPGENDSGDEWIETNLENSEPTVRVVGLQTIEREPLDASFSRILHASEDMLDRLVERLMEASAGRPEIIQIGVQQLADAGAIRFRKGKPQIASTRLERTDIEADPAACARKAWREELTGAEQELAAIIALLGDSIPVSLLGEIVSSSMSTMEDQLASLVSKRIIEMTPATHDRLVECSDDAVREFIRETLEPAERTRRHRMLAFEITDLYEQWDDERFDDGWLCVHAAFQWIAAGEPERSGEWFARAGDVRLTDGRIHNAIALLQEAEKRSEEPKSIRLGEHSLYEIYGDALSVAGRKEEAVERYEEALKEGGFAPSSGDGQRLRLKMARALRQQREYARVRKVVLEYFEREHLQIPTDQQNFGFTLVGLIVQSFVMRTLFQLGILKPTFSPNKQVEKELVYFDAGRMLEASLLRNGETGLLRWFAYTAGMRALELCDSRLLAMAFAGQGLVACRAGEPKAKRGRYYRDLAVDQAVMSRDARVQSFVGGAAAKISLWIGDQERALDLAQTYRPVALSVGSFGDYRHILETLIYLGLYSGNLPAAEQLVNRFVADSNAFGTFEIGHLTNYFQAYIEFLQGRFGEARTFVDAARSVNGRVQDPVCEAQIDWIDFELLWHEGERDDALELAEASVHRIEDGLTDYGVTETLCRAARLATRAAVEAREGRLDWSPNRLLEFAERACDLADKRTKAFPTLRPLVRCQQGHLEWVRGRSSKAMDRLKEGVRLADAAGHTRFQAAAYELRSHVDSDASPLRSLSDARRSKMLYLSCDNFEAIDRVNERIVDLVQANPGLEPFARDIPVTRRQETPGDEEPAETPPESLSSELDPFSTIELSPNETAVEFLAEKTAEDEPERVSWDSQRWPLPPSPQKKAERPQDDGVDKEVELTPEEEANLQKHPPEPEEEAESEERDLHKTPILDKDDSQPPEVPELGGEEGEPPEMPGLGAEKSEPPDLPGLGNEESEPPEFSSLGNEESEPPDFSSLGNEESEPPEFSSLGNEESEPPELPDLDETSEPSEPPETNDEEEPPPTNPGSEDGSSAEVAGENPGKGGEDTDVWKPDEMPEPIEEEGSEPIDELPAEEDEEAAHPTDETIPESEGAEAADKESDDDSDDEPKTAAPTPD